MSLPIITADQRLAERRGVKGVLVGKSGIGKTSQLWTLKPTATLFFDLEAGDLAVEGWAGDTIRPRTWQECRDFAVYIGGPNPALRDDQPFSQAHFDAVCARFGDSRVLDKYDTVFVDSITVAGRLCLQWCKGPVPRRSWSMWLCSRRATTSRPPPAWFCCDPARTSRLCGIAATTAMNGAKAPVDKTDWHPLAGKSVVIWPDRDAPGWDYAESAARACVAAGSTSVAILVPRTDKPPKWDAADAVDEGFDCAAFIAQGLPR